MPKIVNHNMTIDKSYTPPADRSQNLRIALLGYRSHPFVGGQGIYLKYLSRALTKAGHHVTVYSGQPYPELDENVSLIKVPGMNLYESETPFADFTFKHWFNYADIHEWLSKMTGGFGEPRCFGLRIEKIIQPNQYDIIHDNQSLSYSLLKLQTHTPVIATIHHPIHQDRKLAIDDAPNFFHKIMRARWYRFLTMQEKVVKRLQHVTTVSQISLKDIARYFNRNERTVSCIPNGIDTDTFKPNPTIDKQPLQLITTTSSDQPLKGLQFLLKALATIKRHHPNIQLVIIGKLDKNGNNAKLIHALDLKNNITFKHSLSTTDLVHNYHTSCIAICPSLYEGFGLPAGEAMAAGCAVVSTNGGALPEVVGDAGVIVPKGNADELAKAILILLENKTLRAEYEKRGRTRIENRFSWSNVAILLSNEYSVMQHNAQKKCSFTSANDTQTDHMPVKPALIENVATPAHADD